MILAASVIGLAGYVILGIFGADSNATNHADLSESAGGPTPRPNDPRPPTLSAVERVSSDPSKTGRDSRLSVRIRSSAGLPLTNLVARLRSDQVFDSRSFDAALESLSPTESECTVADSFPSSYRLVVTADAHQPGEITLGEIRVLGPDAAVVLRHQTLGSIAGRVIDDSAAPLQGARVAVIGPKFVDRFGETTTDSAGAFRLDGVRAGTALRFECTGGFGTFVFPVAELTPAEQRTGIELVVPRMRQVRLRVIDAASRAALGAADIGPHLESGRLPVEAGGRIQQDEWSTDGTGLAELRVPIAGALIDVGARDHKTRTILIDPGSDSMEVALEPLRLLPVELVRSEARLPTTSPLVTRGRELMAMIPRPEQLVSFVCDDAGLAAPSTRAASVEAVIGKSEREWTVVVDRPPPLTLFLVAGDRALARADVASLSRVQLSVDSDDSRQRAGFRFRLVSEANSAWAGGVALSIAMSPILGAAAGPSRAWSNRSGLRGATNERGEFELSNLVPGEWEIDVHALASERPLEVFRGTVTLKPDAVTDLGAWVVHRPCGLDVAPLATDGIRGLGRVSLFCDEFDAFVAPDPSRSELDRLIWTGTPTAFEGLRPGSYVVEVRVPEYVTARCEVLLRADTRAACAPILERGIRVDVRLVGEAARRARWLVIRRGSGAEVDRIDMSRVETTDGSGGATKALPAFVPAGSTRLELLDAAKQTLEIETLNVTAPTTVTLAAD